eukprot:1614853-Alexandrium_andersonii.AAC.1
MSASLVGSEMCIRDRQLLQLKVQLLVAADAAAVAAGAAVLAAATAAVPCLLYTSDAADDM